MEEEEEVFEFEAILGNGSFGIVYLIKDKSNNRYAVKRINFQGQESERTCALREAELLSKVRHEHILNYVESFEDEECLNIVTEYCDGGDLEVYLKSRNGKSLPEVRICHWVFQIACGLEYLHRQKILHRDLKSKNIFLMSDLSLKLGDLGIAKLLELNQSKAESFVGTPAYMSPELFKHLPYNHKSDMWSFGCCCYEMVALQKAFGNESLFVLCKKVCSNERPPFPKGYSESLKSVLYSMLDEEPDCRPSASDVVRNPYIKKRLAEPIDRSNSPSGLNRNVKSQMKGKSKTHSASKSKKKSIDEHCKTISSSWLNVKRQIETNRRDSHRKSVSRTMEKMKKLRLNSARPQSGASSTCSNYSEDDDQDTILMSDDSEDTMVINQVERTNQRLRNGRTGLKSFRSNDNRSDIDIDDVFMVQQVENKLLSNPDQAAKLMVQGMKDNLTPFPTHSPNSNGTPYPSITIPHKLNGTPFPSRGTDDYPATTETAERTLSNAKSNPKQRKKKKILSKIAGEKKRIERTNSDTSSSVVTSDESSPTTPSGIVVDFKGNESVRMFTHGQKVQFSRGLSNSSDEKEERAVHKKYVPFEKRKTTESVKGIMAMVGSMEKESIIMEITNIQREMSDVIGKENLQKCYEVMAGVKDEELVKALLTEILGSKMYEKYRHQLFYLRMLEITSQAST